MQRTRASSSISSPRHDNLGSTPTESARNVALLHGSAQRLSLGSRPRRTWGRLIAFTVFHCLDYGTNLAVMILLAITEEPELLFPLLVAHLITCAFCVYATALDEDIRNFARNRCWGFLVYALAVFCLGVMQFIQVKLAWRDFRGRRARNNQPLQVASRVTKYHCKAVDGAFEGVVFAAVQFYMFMTQGWNSCEKLTGQCALVSCGQDKDCVPFDTEIWVFLVVSGSLSFVSAGTGLLELDHSVSASTASMLDERSSMIFVHILFRTSEVAARLWLFVLSLWVLLPLNGWIACALWVLDYLITGTILLFFGGREKSCWIVLLFTLPMIAANVVQFVDSPIYASSVRCVNRALFWFRSLELVTFAVLCGPFLPIEWYNRSFQNPWDVLIHLHGWSLFAGAGFVFCYYSISFGYWAFRRNEPDLYSAAAKGDVHAIENLLNETITTELNQLDSQGFAPLHLALRKGSLPVLQLLLRRGADVGLPCGPSLGSCCGDRPLHIAARKGWVAGVHALLAARADPALQNARGKMAAEVARGEARQLLQVTGGLGDAAAGPPVRSGSYLPPLGRSADENTGAPLTATVSVEPALDSDLQRLLRTQSTASQGHKQRRSEVGQFRAPGLSSYVVQHGAGALSRVFLHQLQPVSEGVAPIGLDSFQILDTLGEGTFGIVWLVALVSNPGKRYALKVLHSKQYRMQYMLARARHERHILKAAKHPCIVRLEYAFHTPQRELALVMELCQHGDLQNYLVRFGVPGLPEANVRRWAAQIILALQYLHNRDVIFRDLKTENIVLDASMRAKLTDFGLAKARAQRRGARSFVGSQGYVAPEVTKAMEPYNFAVDLYSLGVVVWVCLSGGIIMIDEDGEERIPPNSPDSFQRYLENPEMMVMEGVTARVGVPFSMAAKSLLKGLTALDPAARTTIPEAKRHEFFVAGSDPVLATAEDWKTFVPVPRHHEAEGESSVSTPTSSQSSSAWSFRPGSSAVGSVQ